ncbi:hypothetical protein H5410_051043 [Solanum commersonii]|uniref:Uncharacterized protein n=1 Tax=Solanum commersonii TaxID=4109 RepID=A0A9J5WZS4_SOLCO|nr:hypothetical protein H5410_051043 [Solanum commersonii]
MSPKGLGDSPKSFSFALCLHPLPVVIVSSGVNLERVNPRPFPTHSARESKWAKAEVVLKSGNSVFKRNRVDSGNRPLGPRSQPIRLAYINIVQS